MRLFQNIFAENDIQPGNIFEVYQSKYPENSCEIPWNEVLVLNNKLAIVYDDYLVFFKKSLFAEKQGKCISEAVITRLPLSHSILTNGKLWNVLECTIEDLDTRDYIRLPDIQDIQIFIFANFDYDDYIYTLVTIKNDKIITKKDIGFASDGYPDSTFREVTQFEITKDYVFKITLKEKKKIKMLFKQN